MDSIRLSQPATYRKFTWVGNQISPVDMGKLYQIKRARRIPITKLVATAVREFLEKEEQQNTLSKEIEVNNLNQKGGSP